MRERPVRHPAAIPVQAVNIPELVQRLERAVRHAQLFALIDIRCALHHVQAGCQHFRAADAPLRAVIAERGHGARLVVVAEEEAVPRLAVQLCLPFAQYLFQEQHRNLFRAPRPVFSGDVHMLELEDHAQLMRILSGVLLCLLDGHARRFAHGHQVIAGQHPRVHFLQILMHMRTVNAVCAKVSITADGGVRVIRHFIGFRNHAYDIHAEAVHALVAPPCHHAVHVVAQFRILPVQIGLLRRE